MFKCPICKEEFSKRSELESHDAGHLVRPVEGKILSYILVLPDGVRSGRYEAAEAFSEAFTELRKKHPGMSFDFLPFSYASDNGKFSGLNAILAIAR